MNKLRVIDLLNKIANGKEVPKKIQVYSDIFVLDYLNGIYEHEETRTNLLSIYNGNILNYEVRIIEDKPFNERVEKITNMNCIDAIDSNCYERYSNKAIALDINTLRHQINKVIDYIKEEK